VRTLEGAMMGQIHGSMCHTSRELVSVLILCTHTHGRGEKLRKRKEERESESEEKFYDFYIFYDN
jgi:hypothetical protein